MIPYVILSNMFPEILYTNISTHDQHEQAHS